MISSFHHKTTFSFMLICTIGLGLNALSLDQETIIENAQYFANYSYVRHLPSLYELENQSNSETIINTTINNCYSFVSRWTWGVSKQTVKNDFLNEWKKIEHHRTKLINESHYSHIFKHRAARPLATLTLLACKANLVLESLGEKQTLYMGQNIRFQDLLSNSIKILLEQLTNNLIDAHQQLDRCINESDINNIINNIQITELMQSIQDARQALSYLFNINNNYDQRIHTLEIQIERFNARTKIVLERINCQKREAERKNQQEIREKERKIAQLQALENEQNRREERLRQQEYDRKKHQERLQQEHNQRQRQLNLERQLATLRKKLNDAIARNNLPLIEQFIREAERLGFGNDESVNVAREVLSQARAQARLAAHGEHMQNQEKIHASRTQVEKDMHAQLQRTTINIEYADNLVNQAKAQNITHQNSNITHLMIDRIRDAIVQELAHIISQSSPYNTQRLTYLVEKAMIYGLQRNVIVNRAIHILNEQTSSIDPFANASAPPAPVATYKIIECESCYDDFSAQDLYICPQKGCHIKFCINDLEIWINRSKQCPICHSSIMSMSNLKRCTKTDCQVCHDQ